MINPFSKNKIFNENQLKYIEESKKLLIQLEESE